MAWISIFITFASGVLLMHALAPASGKGSRIAALLRQGAIGVFVGPGIVSLLCFCLLKAGIFSRASVITMLLGFALASGIVWRLRRHPDPLSRAQEPLLWKRFLLLALSLGIVAFVLRFTAISWSVPEGEYDALAMWNLKTKYLADGEPTWQRALGFDPQGYTIRVSHPGYPLYLPGFLAVPSTIGGEADPSIPRAVSFLFAAASIALAGGNLALFKSRTLACFACLVLFASRDFVHQSAWQYADTPLALGILATLVLLDQAARDDARDDARDGAQNGILFAAGLALGMTPWLKNEGWPFALITLACAGWRFGIRRVPWICLGALPGLAATLWLKTIAIGSERFIPTTMAEALSRIMDPGRWLVIVMGFARDLAGTGTLWAHPAILIALLAAVLGWESSREWRARLWLGIPLAVMMASYAAVYSITSLDLEFHLRTSASRFLVQLWPASIWFVFSLLRDPSIVVARSVETSRTD